MYSQQGFFKNEQYLRSVEDYLDVSGHSYRSLLTKSHHYNSWHPDVRFDTYTNIIQFFKRLKLKRIRICFSTMGFVYPSYEQDVSRLCVLD